MKHIVLVGGSIFDNARYVGEGESVTEMLEELVAADVKVSLITVDGLVTSDVLTLLDTFPPDATHVFVSCGGNDALRVVHVLSQAVSSVGESLEYLVNVRENFRTNYKNMLNGVLKKNKNLTVCSVYDCVPGISKRALAALALFNEVILKEAVEYRLPIIDLRNICKDPRDYSEIAPSAPSGKGAEKIVSVINKVVGNHEFGVENSRIYV